MDFIEHAQIMIPALTGLAVTIWDGSSRTLEDFEKQFCFLPDIQTLYTVKGMQLFFEKKDDRHIYELTDALDTHAVLIKIDGKWIILGPYVTEAWQENATRVLLAGYGIEESMRLPYKLYRSRLPLLGREYIIRIAFLLLAYTVENNPLRELEVIHPSKGNPMPMQVYMTEKYEELELINKRYAIESQLENSVYQGNTEDALKWLKELYLLVPGLKYMSDTLGDHIAGAAILRTLVRHAALRADLSPVLVDALSQEYAQRMHHAVEKQQLYELQEQCIAAFCHAIRNNNKNEYSVYVKRAIQYIDIHLSQPITIDELCELGKISRTHFVHLFGKETGKTVKQYIMQRRCEYAAGLLENSKLSVQEISHYVGYEDNNYFSKVFKRVMGVSPQDYRRMKSFY